MPVDVCVLTGAEWNFHSNGTGKNVDRMLVVDHPTCATEFSLDRGEEHRWQISVRIPDDAGTGTLDLKLTILRGPRTKHGLYSGGYAYLASQPIPIEIVSAE
jgi:hypothetical protein